MSATSNFAFLQPDWPDLLAEARRAEAAAHADPRTACFYARRTLELAVAWLYQAEGAGWLFAHAVQGGFVGLPVRAQLSATGGQRGARQDGCDSPPGQPGVHRRPPGAAAGCAQRAARAVPCGLLAGAALCAPRGRPACGGAAVSRRSAAPACRYRLCQQEQAASRAAQAAAQEALAKQAQAPRRDAAALREAAARNAELDAELARYRAEIAAAKAANAAQPATAHDYNEAATRDLFIDLLLKEAGWALDEARP